jgi:type IV conjugative transfer system protein TraL
MKRVPFPQYLSRPMQFLWWESDELAVLLLFVGLAMMFEGVFWLLPFVGSYTFVRLKREHPKDFLRHVFYFIGLTRLRGYPEYWEREFSE